jgi:hypothetical protein
MADPLGLDGGAAAPSGGYTVPERKPDMRAAYGALMNAPDATMRSAGMTGMARIPELEAAQQERVENRNFRKDEADLNRAQRKEELELRIADTARTNTERLAAQKELRQMQIDSQKDIQRMIAANRPERQAQIIQTDQGPMQFVGGKALPIMGPSGVAVKGTSGGDKPLNETQGNATAFGLRMAEADKLLNTLETGGTTSGGRIKGAVEGTLTSIIPYQGEALAQGAGSIMNTLPNWLGGPNENQQNYAQAKENFITANLRKESGAAIGQGEFVREERKYFPQAGDSPAVLAQKQKARQTAIEAMKIQAGPGAKNIEAKNPSTSPRLRFDAQGNQIQ